MWKAKVEVRPVFVQSIHSNSERERDEVEAGGSLEVITAAFWESLWRHITGSVTLA